MLNRYTLPLISALVVSASLASCQRKEVASVPELPPAGEIGFTVSDSDAETKSTPLKTDYFSTNHNPFNVVVYSHAEGAATSGWELFSGTQTCLYNTSSGIWKPSTAIGWPMTEEKLTFIAYAPTSLPYPTTSSGGALTSGEAPFLKNFTVNSNVAQQVDILLASKESSASPLVQDVNVGLTFRHALTFVKFSIGVRTTCSSITLSGIPGTGTLDMNTGEWSFVGTSATYTISDPTFGSWDSNWQCPIADGQTLMLIPQTLPEGATLTAETSAGPITASLAGQVWEPGKEVTYKLTDPVPFFSVSATQKVCFSPGNLQAVFAVPGTSFTWKFADNQWDYVGNAAANTSINGYGSVSAAGTVDLFGWSTNDSSDKYGISNSWFFGAFKDWGTDSDLISALGSGWRTLTIAEWTYLLNTRTGNRYCKATVNGVSGLVIFPDYYSHPSGVTAPASVNTSDAAFTSNTWSDTDWAKMESAGCVFLPAAGHRNGASVGGVNSGNYWSSTRAGSPSNGNAYRPSFGSSWVTTDGYDNNWWGDSVRLVRNL